MAKAKATATTIVATQLVFTKDQLRKASRFSDRRDVLEVALAKHPDNESLSFEQVEKEIEEFLKGKVN